MSALIDLLRAVTPAPIRGAARRFRLDRAFMRGRLDRREFSAYCAELEGLWPVIDAAHERWVESNG